MDVLYRFEFDESFMINAIVLRAESFTDAITNLRLVCDYLALDHVISIHKIL